jgi:hypothetical protein
MSSAARQPGATRPLALSLLLGEFLDEVDPVRTILPCFRGAARDHERNGRERGGTIAPCRQVQPAITGPRRAYPASTVIQVAVDSRASFLGGSGWVVRTPQRLSKSRSSARGPEPPSTKATMAAK